MMVPADTRTMFDRIWDAHVVEALDAERSLVYVDRHLIHEGTTAPRCAGPT
jgi:homoaconitase/3-isopropylmalate dehydratase large subunit